MENTIAHSSYTKIEEKEKMSSKSTYLDIPIIDFSNPYLKQGSCDWELVKSQVQKSFEEYGCFKAIFDKISPDLQMMVFDSLKELFGLPSDIKELNVSEKPFHGYYNIQSMQSYESFGIENPTTFDAVESLSNIFWPQGNPRFSKSIVSFAKEAWELAKIISTMIIESLGMEKYLEEHMDSLHQLLRVMKYEGPQKNEKMLRLQPHMDMNLVTILYQNQVDGLEVKTKDGEWINVQFSPNSLTIIAGESLVAWTNGRVHAPHHQVVTSGNEARYSLGFFAMFKQGYLIKTPEELVDEEHPLLYKPFDYFEYLNSRSQPGKIGYKESSIRDYCGA